MNRLVVIAGIIVNLFLPGLGTVIMGKWLTGVIQLALIGAIWLVGMVTFGLGAMLLAPLHGIVWVWALIAGLIQLSATGSGRSQLGR